MPDFIIKSGIFFAKKMDVYPLFAEAGRYGGENTTG